MGKNGVGPYRECHYTCRLCTNGQFDGCLTCAANRVGPSSGQCLCPAGYESYLFTAQCGSYSKPVVRAQLSPDLSTVTVSFQTVLETPAGDFTTQSAQTCLSLLALETVQKLGLGYSCSLQRDTLTIELGVNNTLVIGDELLLNSKNPPLVKMYGVFVTELTNAQILAPTYMLAPVVVLAGDPGLKTTCSSYSVMVKSVKNDGRKGLKQWTWFLQSGYCSSECTQALQSASSASNTAQQFVTLPTNGYGEGTIIGLSFTTYFQQSGSVQFQVQVQNINGYYQTTLSKADNSMDLTFYPFEQVTVRATIRSQYCGFYGSYDNFNYNYQYSYELQQEHSQHINKETVSVTQTSGPLTIGAENIRFEVLDENESVSYIVMTIPPFALSASSNQKLKLPQTYDFMFSYYGYRQNSYYYKVANIKVVASPLTVRFLVSAGLKQQSLLSTDFRQPFTIAAAVNDPDSQDNSEDASSQQTSSTADQQSLFYLIEWNCTVLSSGQPCTLLTTSTDINNNNLQKTTAIELAQLMQNQAQFTIPAFAFQPYTAVRFSLTASQFPLASKSGSAALTVLFAESSQTLLLETQLNPTLFFAPLCLSDEIYVQIALPSSEQTESGQSVSSSSLQPLSTFNNLLVTATLLYSGRTAGQRQFRYNPAFILVPWDLFDGLLYSATIMQLGSASAVGSSGQQSQQYEEVVLQFSVSFQSSEQSQQQDQTQTQTSPIASASNSQQQSYLSSVALHVYPPPQQCVFSVEPTVGDALSTMFTLSVQKCSSQQMPLRYRFQLYQNRSDYATELSQGYSQGLFSTTQNRALPQIIADYQPQPSVQIRLPAGLLNDEVLLLVSVQDAQGAIANLTQVVQVQRPASQAIQTQLLNGLFDEINTQQGDISLIPKNVWLLSVICMTQDISITTTTNSYNNALAASAPFQNMLLYYLHTLSYTQPSTLYAEQVLSLAQLCPSEQLVRQVTNSLLAISQLTRVPDLVVQPKEPFPNSRSCRKSLVAALLFADRMLSQKRAMQANQDYTSLVKPIVDRVADAFSRIAQPNDARFFQFQGRSFSLSVGNVVFVSQTTKTPTPTTTPTTTTTTTTTQSNSTNFYMEKNEYSSGDRYLQQLFARILPTGFLRIAPQRDVLQPQASDEATAQQMWTTTQQYLIVAVNYSLSPFYGNPQLKYLNQSAAPVTDVSIYYNSYFSSSSTSMLLSDPKLAAFASSSDKKSRFLTLSQTNLQSFRFSFFYTPSAKSGNNAKSNPVCLVYNPIDNSFSTTICKTVYAPDINTVFCDCSQNNNPVFVVDDYLGSFVPLPLPIATSAKYNLLDVDWVRFPVPIFLAFQTLLWFAFGLWGNYKDDQQCELLLKEANNSNNNNSPDRQSSETLPLKTNNNNKVAGAPVGISKFDAKKKQDQQNSAQQPQQAAQNQQQQQSAGSFPASSIVVSQNPSQLQQSQNQNPPLPKQKKLDPFQLLRQQIKEQEAAEQGKELQQQEKGLELGVAPDNNSGTQDKDKDKDKDKLFSYDEENDEDEQFGIYVEELQTKRRICRGELLLVSLSSGLLCGGLCRLNELYTIFRNYKKKMRRQLRFSLLFVRSLVLAVLAGVFSEGLHEEDIQQIDTVLTLTIYALAFSGFASLSLFIVKMLLRSNLKPCGTLIVLAGLVTTVFFLLGIALDKQTPAHEWSLAYGIALFVDFIVFELFSILIKILLFVLLFRNARRKGQPIDEEELEVQQPGQQQGTSVSGNGRKRKPPPITWNQCKSLIYIIIYDEDLVNYLTTPSSQG